ncbi:hypothetical protein ELE36_13935 [Pseudolysobacter antarcticus]|uniref:Secreted protein n=1 Tax=Pseudolysobacter antarcticus TaxID=2511995 RepID=A0A411HLT0_9GAMM|nr:hypothetical protein [Pseudolysobacter antarcticus]QBB71364.1 hypothetical protein ELE36_13935 [Pseudolysobacter antarcticus]
MKNIYVLLLSSACAFVPAAAFAVGGTCAAPDTTTLVGPTPTASGTTCGNGNQVDAFCGGAQVVSNQPQVIYQITLSAPGTGGRATSIAFTGATANTATWHPTMYLYSGTCLNGGGCVQTGVVGAGGANITTVAAGTYFLAVGGSQIDATDAAGGAAACGAFQIGANGTLPVALQSFSVQ